MTTIDTSRRQFLRQSTTLSVGSAMLSPWLLNLSAIADAAAAESTAGYKALVCVFLAGGNDACNTILPASSDTASWARYEAVRPQIKLARNTGVSILNGANSHALHPMLAKTASLYGAGRLAFVANVGNLLGTLLDRSRFEQPAASTIPARLRSHNDQQTAWQSGQTNVAAYGWGGRFGAQQSFGTNDPSDAFRSIRIGGSNDTFSVGESLLPYGMVARQNGVIGLLPLAQAPQDALYGKVPRSGLLKVVRGAFTTPRSNLIERDYSDVVARALDNEQYLNGLLGAPGTSPVTVPDFELARALEVVGRVIKGHATKTGRQVFFVTLGGFDTHGSQLDTHAKRLEELDASLSFFDALLGAHGLRPHVTTFTMSDFGRLLNANGDGSDHGWGGHQIVMGDAVAGGRIHGQIPAYAQANGSSAPQLTGDGALIPDISIGSYAATLGRWFGIRDEALLRSFFPYACTAHGSAFDVGFMKA